MGAMTAFQEACRRHRVALAYLFGSKADLGLRLLQGGNGEPVEPLADLDLGVVMLDPLPPPYGRYRFYADLHESLSGFFPGVPFDLLLLDEHHAVFQTEALLGHCVYAADEGYRDDYEQRILARAADFRPFLDLYYRERLGEV